MADTLFQGNLDCGCGFYSILNAISEVNGMSWERCKEFFFTYTRKHRDIAANGYIRGLYFTEIRDRIVPDMIAMLKKDEKVSYSFPYAATKFASLADYTDALRVALEPEETSAVLGFGTPWHHWTAATGVSDTAILLKDSTEHEMKLFTSLVLATDEKPYYPADITQIHSRQTILFK